jgi:hypothetical protein
MEPHIGDSDRKRSKGIPSERFKPKGAFLDKFISYSSIYAETTLGVAITFIAIFELVPILRNYTTFFLPDLIYSFLLWGTLIFVLSYWGKLVYKTWFGQLIIGLFSVACYFPLSGAILRRDELIGEFPILYLFALILVITMAVGLLLNVINFLFLIPIHHFWVFKGPTAWRTHFTRGFRSHGKEIAFGFICTCMLGFPTILLMQPTSWNLPITVQPQDYQAEIAFWGMQEPDVYTDPQKETLDNHRAIIIHFDTPNINIPAIEADYLSHLTYWNNSYPNIRIMAAIPAQPSGGFVWDGEVEQTVEYAKKFMNLAKDNNLVNFIGISLDIEAPNEEVVEALGMSTLVNRTRHEESRQKMIEFFNWRDEYMPDMKVQMVADVSDVMDVFDGDNDLQVIKRHNGIEVPRYDEYAPMIYRCGYRGTKPYGDYPETLPEDQPSDHYWTYANMQLLTRGVEYVYGNRDKLGVYLGITNCSCYGRDVQQYDRGEPAGFGYESLVRDSLIAKHFGAPIITIFILNTVPENGYSMGGVFDVWGDDFLDVYNESINGPGSTTPFNIWYAPDIQGNLININAAEWVILDWLWNLEGPLGIIIMVAIVVFNIYVMRNRERMSDDQKQNLKDTR